jgi:RNase P subunit RPR2
MKFIDALKELKRERARIDALIQALEAYERGEPSEPPETGRKKESLEDYVNMKRVICRECGMFLDDPNHDYDGVGHYRG